jgi:hypothetical protein
VLVELTLIQRDEGTSSRSADCVHRLYEWKVHYFATYLPKLLNSPAQMVPIKEKPCQAEARLKVSALLTIACSVAGLWIMTVRVFLQLKH